MCAQVVLWRPFLGASSLMVGGMVGSKQGLGLVWLACKWVQRAAPPAQWALLGFLGEIERMREEGERRSTRTRTQYDAVDAVPWEPTTGNREKATATLRLSIIMLCT